jgi:hypothetical protein
MSKAYYTIPTHIKGNTFPGVEITLYLNGLPVDLTGVSIVMGIAASPTGSALYTLTTTGGHLTITDAENGIFTIDEQIINFNAATYYYQMQFTFPDGKIKTLVDGSWSILPSVA